ncbi:phasin family protein [Chelativorans xinjiangense]|uniref:phasin family protein n=1 Tax=Chelativorans xinjiangense TaxID=2681485 RepID=UPI001FE2D361|nr:phasin family protein [Chelativorans xinjiangense]
MQDMPVQSPPLTWFSIGDGQQFVQAAAWLQTHTFKAIMRYQIEALSFLKHRLEQDVKLIDDLTASSEYNDTFDVFGVFMQNAASDYSAEAARIATIGSRLASETAREARKEARATIDGMAVGTPA